MLTHTHVYATTNIHIRTRTLHIHAHSRSYVYNVNLHIPTHVVCPSGFIRRLQKGTGKRTSVKHELFSVCVCVIVRCYCDRGAPRSQDGPFGLSRSRGPLGGSSWTSRARLQDPPWGPLEARVSCRGTMFKASWAKLQAPGSMLELPWRSGDTSYNS